MNRMMSCGLYEGGMRIFDDDRRRLVPTYEYLNVPAVSTRGWSFIRGRVPHPTFTPIEADADAEQPSAIRKLRRDTSQRPFRDRQVPAFQVHIGLGVRKRRQP